MKAFDYQPVFRKDKLSNGVRVISEHHPYSRSTSLGCYINLGARDEPSNLNGVAHFLEHLLFKGTETRSAYDIVKDLEVLGGEINAFTSRESTCFHASTLREHVSVSLEVLSDLMNSANFSEEDVKKECEVILQEIDMTADLLEEHIFDLFLEHIYEGHSLGRPILGTKESLKSMTHQQIMNFYKSRYCGENLTIALAGHVDHDKVCEQAESLFQGKLASAEDVPRTKPKNYHFFKKIPRPSEQAHLLMGLPSSYFGSEYRFEAFIANTFLGGGMTSQLYQKIREEKALAYNVYSCLQSFTDSGLIMIYAATSKNKLSQTMGVIEEEIHQLQQKGISQDQLEMFRTQVIGSLLLGADDVDSRMNSIAVNEMIFGEYRPVEQVVRGLEAVTLDSMKAYISSYLKTENLGTLVLGDV